jgi:RNA polymerase sigma factor (sigma-70 family)
MTPVTDTDSRAAGAVVETDLPSLRRYARSLLTRYRIPSGWLQPDDVVQYAIAELLEHRSKIDNPEAYVRAVAWRFVLRAAHDRRHVADAPVDDESRSVSVHPVAPVEDQVETRIVAERVYRELAALPPQQGRAVYLIQAVGTSRAEAAALMGTAEGTVSSHLHRGMTRLRDTLGYVLGSFTAVLAVLAIVVEIVPGRSRGLLAGAEQQVLDPLKVAIAGGGSGPFLVPVLVVALLLAWVMRSLKRRRPQQRGPEVASGSRRVSYEPPIATNRRRAVRATAKPGPFPGLLGPGEEKEPPPAMQGFVGGSRRRVDEWQVQRMRQSAVRRYE